MVSSDLQVEIRIGGTVQMNDIAHAWEQCMLGDITSVVGGNPWKSQNYNENGAYLVVTISNVTGDLFIDDRKVRFFIFEKTKI